MSTNNIFSIETKDNTSITILLVVVIDLWLSTIFFWYVIWVYPSDILKNSENVCQINWFRPIDTFQKLWYSIDTERQETNRKELIEMLLGYIRVSTIEQNEERQTRALLEKGVEEENLYIDKQSGKNTDRKQLKALLAFCR